MEDTTAIEEDMDMDMNMDEEEIEDAVDTAEEATE